MAGRLLITLTTLFLSQASFAIPVYLRPNWPVATENLSSDELKDSIINEAESTWLKVELNDGKIGWLLQEDVLTPLFFSKLISLKAEENLFLRPDFRATPVRTVDKAQLVELIDQRGLWVEVKLENGAMYWAKEDSVEPYSKDPGVFYTKTPTQLKQKPLNQSPILREIPSGQKITVKSLIKSQWAQVVYKGKTGFIPLTHLKSRIDIAQKVRTSQGWQDASPHVFNQKIFEVIVDPQWTGTGEFTVELKQSPQVQARTMTTIQPWSDLEVLSRKKIRWAQSHTKEHGEVWWEKEEKIISIPKVKQLTNIRQIIRNPKSKLFFASANGLFKSLNGLEWEPVEEMANKSQAISVAKDGTLFVGEKLTTDHGKSFHPYIKWDNLVEQLTYLENIHPKYLSILKITPLEGSSQKIMLKLDVGDKKTVNVVSDDQGKNWKLVR